MTDENLVLIEVASILESTGIDYMLTDSIALNFYATPRMTRDVDLVAVVLWKDIEKLITLFPSDQYYLSDDAIKEAILHQSSFNIIHQKKLVKIDVIIRKREEYRLLEFERRKKVTIHDHHVWIVSKEDLILSKLSWADGSESSRQIDDVKNLLADSCDMEYIQTWAKHLNLTDMLTLVTA